MDFVSKNTCPFDVCRRRTKVGVCDTYTDIDVCVRKSAVHGNGLFANRDMPGGYIIGYYAGPKLTQEEFLTEQNLGNMYLFDYKNDDTGEVSYSIDGRCLATASVLRYINVPVCQQNRNSFWIQHGGNIYLELARDVNAHEELFAEYGVHTNSFTRYSTFVPKDIRMTDVFSKKRVSHNNATTLVQTARYYEEVAWNLTYKNIIPASPGAVIRDIHVTPIDITYTVSEPISTQPLISASVLLKRTCDVVDQEGSKPKIKRIRIDALHSEISLNGRVVGYEGHFGQIRKQITSSKKTLEEKKQLAINFAMTGPTGTNSAISDNDSEYTPM